METKSIKYLLPLWESVRNKVRSSYLRYKGDTLEVYEEIMYEWQLKIKAMAAFKRISMLEAIRLMSDREINDIYVEQIVAAAYDYATGFDYTN